MVMNVQVIAALATGALQAVGVEDIHQFIMTPLFVHQLANGEIHDFPSWCCSCLPRLLYKKAKNFALDKAPSHDLALERLFANQTSAPGTQPKPKQS